MIHPPQGGGERKELIDPLSHSAYFAVFKVASKGEAMEITIKGTKEEFLDSPIEAYHSQLPRAEWGYSDSENDRYIEEGRVNLEGRWGCSVEFIIE